MAKRKCEFCATNFLSRQGTTVCSPCDSSLEASQNAEMAARAKKHADKYKCNKCGIGLPESRRRNCIECVRSNNFTRHAHVDDYVEFDEDYLYFSEAS